MRPGYPTAGGHDQGSSASRVQPPARSTVPAWSPAAPHKVADPTSVLGYSKRIAERLTAHIA